MSFKRGCCCPAIFPSFFPAVVGLLPLGVTDLVDYLAGLNVLSRFEGGALELPNIANEGCLTFEFERDSGFFEVEEVAQPKRGTGELLIESPP